MLAIVSILVSDNLVVKRIIVVVIVAILLLVPLSFAYVQKEENKPIHNEAGSFTFVDKKGNPDKPIKVWYYRPANLSANSPLVFVMHGIHRDAHNYRNDWINYAKQYGFLLIAPEFSKRYYPGTDYNYGNMFDEKGLLISEDKWAFSAVDHLFDYVKEVTKNQSPKYWIYGHSAGGQFVHRMTLFKTEALVQRAIAANPGVYVMPSFAIEFPYGFKGSGMTPEKLKAAFGKDFLLLLGDKDINEDDPVLNKTPQAMAQGKNRFERGHNFYRAAEGEAAQLGEVLHWTLKTVPGAAHHDSQMARAAVKLLFQESGN